MKVILIQDLYRNNVRTRRGEIMTIPDEPKVERVVKGKKVMLPEQFSLVAMRPLREGEEAPEGPKVRKSRPGRSRPKADEAESADKGSAVTEEPSAGSGDEL